MAKGKRKKNILAEKAKRKKLGMMHPSGQSKYGRKQKYCKANDVFGFQVPEPKPWK